MLASGLFILLTLIKLLLPEQSAGFRAALHRMIARDADYEAALSAVGERLGLIIETPEPTRAPLNLDYISICSPDALPELRRTMAESRPKAKAPEPPSETPAVVAAFMESQAAFSDYELPASVSIDMPPLPFEYESPVTGMTSSGFGYRMHPIAGVVRFHYGTDFAAWSGTDIQAFADGVVRVFGWDAGYGNYVIIDHADGWSTLYAHCSTVYVSGGESVSMGDKIALVGATGDVTGPHLHFELRHDGLYYNPEFWLA